MTQATRKAKVEYGDFQTPLELAEKVCNKLVELGVNPVFIVEPTCGVGNFIDASVRVFTSASKIVGIEINQEYLEKLRDNKFIIQDKRVEIKQGNFFEFSWLPLIKSNRGDILVIGNFPWVTNSQQGAIGGVNLPQKNNFQRHSGLDAITGKSNFDISEWMLIQAVDWLQSYDGYLAMLCKTSVARKLLNYLYANKRNLTYFSTYGIDAKKYFSATVDACLLFCKFEPGSPQYFCDVFRDLESSDYHRIGYHNKTLVRDIEVFERLSSLYEEKGKTKWRSGIKHDCSDVMEFRKVDNALVNGLGEVIDIEKTYLFPLLKGSDVAKGRTRSTERYVLVTQRYVGEPTEYIRDSAPKTWNYLIKYESYLDSRKSKIYKKHPRFSIFGVGAYTFKPWKIAICGLYKKLDFRLIGKIENKSAIFDDTVYFLSFDEESVARKTFELLTSPTAINFYSSLIFWDEKRPIKSSILNSLNLAALEK
jgi:hypothetical protein